MSTRIKELKNLTDLMTDANLKLLVCDIGFENIENEFFFKLKYMGFQKNIIRFNFT